MTRVLVVTPDLSDNSTGRAYVWWLLAESLGWECSVISYRGNSVWAPLHGTVFASTCQRRRPSLRRDPGRDLSILSGAADLVVAVKPLPHSLGICLDALRHRRFPLVADIDDPDLEARTHHARPLRRVAWRARHFRFWLRIRDFGRLSRRLTVVVSNPVLQRRYGGTLIPHARPDAGPGAPHVSTSPLVAFIGTVRTHKGIDVLRSAVAALQPLGARLLVTARPPDDARPWEEWVGEGTISEGESLLARADIVALPSLSSSFAEGQLPAKLVDAMMRGRVTVVSRIEPMPWAVDEPSLCVEPGSAEELTAVLATLRDPAVREMFGSRLRERAMSEFSVAAVAPRLVDVLETATRTAHGEGSSA